MADLVGALADPDVWLRQLEAERVTRSGESFEELVQRLEGERPSALRQMALRAEHENAMNFERQRAQVELARRTSTGRWSQMEKRLGEERLALAVSEMYGKASARRGQMEGKKHE